MVTREEFAIQVKDALAHLYDNVHLQNHPLVEYLAIESGPDTVTRAKRLRETLIEIIEELKPDPRIPFGSREWRGYRILYQLYIEGMSWREVMEELALGSSQFYRERQKALEAVVSLLRDKKADRERREWGKAEAEMGSGVLQAEVARMAARSTKERLKLGEVIQEVLSLAQALAVKKAVTLRPELPEALPPIYMDRTVLRQILVNALCQAIERTAQGCVVTMAAATRDNQVILDIFTKALDAAWRGKEESIRLTGLTVAQRLAESQGGRVELAEKGAIRIVLPTAKSTTVLVVDDNEDAIRLFQRYLAEHGYQVIGARSCEEALRLASKLKPQVITLDVMMPNRDGWEALRALKNSLVTRHIPIIVCSVLEDAELSLALGAQEHLTKPISEETLLAALERWRVKSAAVTGSPV